jgi:hypothetical protein
MDLHDLRAHQSGDHQQLQDLRQLAHRTGGKHRPGRMTGWAGFLVPQLRA